MKAKAKKTPKKSHFLYADPLVASRSIIGLLIVLLGGSVVLLFRTYEQNIITNNMFYPFIILTFVGMGLLASLLFLINPSHSKHK